jgi:hypothetical protein
VTRITRPFVKAPNINRKCSTPGYTERNEAAYRTHWARCLLGGRCRRTWRDAGSADVNSQHLGLATSGILTLERLRAYTRGEKREWEKAEFQKTARLTIPSVRPDFVFLNIPYDASFERLYISYIVGISAFRLIPHTTLEIPDSTRRLDRIQALLHECRYSIHDLSRVQVSRKGARVPRFNMPFELGLAVSWSHVNPDRHSWFVCDSERHRVLKSTSDLAGTDFNIHDGTIRGVMRELCNMFIRQSVRPDVSQMMKQYRRLRSAIPHIQQRAGSRTLYEPRVFADICYAAAGFREGG